MFVGRRRNAENAKNWLSAMAEMQKMEKTVFRPWPMNQKRRKLTFGHGRNSIIYSLNKIALISF